MSRIARDMQDFQHEVDEIHGEGEWTVKEYINKTSPLVIVHKCGKEKRLTRANTFTTMGISMCKDCDKKKDRSEQRDGRGKPRLTFEELDKRIKDATYGTYELVDMIDSLDFTVNHKSCERPPFKTSISRFFSRGQRCQCSKKGVVGKKPKEYTD